MAGLPSSFDDVEASAIASLKAGETLTTEAEETEAALAEPDFMDEAYSEDDSTDEGTDELEAALDAPDDKADNKDTVESIEYVKADGKSIKVDFEDREHIKKVYQLAAGARRWQAERDAELKKNEEMSESHTKLRSAMDKLEAVKDDDEQLYTLITGGRSLEDKFREWQKKEDELALLSPSELEARRQTTEWDKRQTELARREAALEAKLEAAESKLGDSHVQVQQAMVNEAFNKHRFAGQLGNKDDEFEIDQMFFGRLKERLNSYEDLTPDIIGRETEAISNSIRRTLKIQTDRKADKIVKRRKDTAATKAQDAAFDGGDKTNKRKELARKIKEGDITGVMSNMGDFFKVLS